MPWKGPSGIDALRHYRDESRGLQHRKGERCGRARHRARSRVPRRGHQVGYIVLDGDLLNFAPLAI